MAPSSSPNIPPRPEGREVGEVDYPPDADEPDPGNPPTLRLRVAKWDLLCTLVLTALLLYLATATEWPFRLYGFLKDVCTGDSCGPVPYGVDIYIYPVSWGGIGAALAAAGIGPFVSYSRAGTCPSGPFVAGHRDGQLGGRLGIDGVQRALLGLIRARSR